MFFRGVETKALRPKTPLGVVLAGILRHCLSGWLPTVGFWYFELTFAPHCYSISWRALLFSLPVILCIVWLVLFGIEFLPAALEHCIGSPGSDIPGHWHTLNTILVVLHCDIWFCAGLTAIAFVLRGILVLRWPDSGPRGTDCSTNFTILFWASVHVDRQYPAL